LDDTAKPGAAGALDAFIVKSQGRIKELEDIQASEASEKDKQDAATATLRRIAAELVKIGKDYDLKDLAYEKLDVPGIEFNRMVYKVMNRVRATQVLERGAAPGPPPKGTPDMRLMGERFDAVMAAAERGYKSACAAKLGPKDDPRTFEGNIFEFAKKKYFVDHEAFYVFPLDRVKNNRGRFEGMIVLASKPEIASREELDADPVRGHLFHAFAYTADATSIEEFRKDAYNVALGNPMDSNQGAMFLAAMVAEPTRNPNAHLTNMLLLDENSPQPFFEAAPMTGGGTSAESKERDPTLATVEGTIKPPPMTVSDDEIKLVCERYKAEMHDDLIALYRKDPSEAEALLEIFLSDRRRLP
jgi:hypothetical protein